MLEELTHMDRITQLQDEIEQLLNIMSSSIAYLCAKADFKQVSEHIPLTRTRPPEKVDPPDVFEANKKEMVGDLMRKTRQIHILIQSLPVPEPESEQAARLESLENEMTTANREYKEAVARAKNLHAQITSVLEQMLTEKERPLS
ncbi:hypothetical protein SISNIDRAFT_444091 [Sistotremastrum niveocremeum HHB9708]|uniref:Mediator of RNA polymerase II transcription subunit 21 n=1 Tax=Sistotremastrum niveocremeum HHB9708 TaxID=1314777 RepID=A0A164R3L8_9AGAM|nr:hypothetical protein SISNIDRAFT_444091 [Sistotremastrum niveocremeum HHB9708]